MKKRGALSFIAIFLVIVTFIAIGKIYKKDAAPGGNKALEESVRQLQSIGYLGGYQKAPRHNVAEQSIPYDALAPGATLITSGHAPRAYLISADRKVLHEWEYEFEKIFPEYKVPPKNRKRDLTGYWRNVALLPNGDLLAIFEGLALIKLDKDSNLIWAKLNNAHHDLEVLPSGDIVVLTRQVEIHQDNAVLVDYISYLREDGTEYKKISLVDAILKSKSRDSIIQNHRVAHDFLHSNSVQIIEDAEASLIPGTRPGDVLVSMRNINTLGVFRPSTAELMWYFQDSFKMQHSARICSRKKELMLFDNMGGKKHTSRIVRYNLPTLDFKGQIDSSHLRANFVSRSLGHVQALSNGNLLIADSEAGRVYEVSDTGKLLWRYTSPHRTGDKRKLIATIPVATRVSEEVLAALIGDHSRVPTL